MCEVLALEDLSVRTSAWQGQVEWSKALFILFSEQPEVQVSVPGKKGCCWLGLFVWLDALLSCESVSLVNTPVHRSEPQRVSMQAWSISLLDAKSRSLVVRCR